MKILIRENDRLNVVDPADVGPLADVLATTPRAMVAMLAANRAWRMSMLGAGFDPHPDNLIDWLWHAGVIGGEDDPWLKAVPALIADRCWSEAAYCLLMAGFAAPLRLAYFSPADYAAQQPALQPGAYALGGGCYQRQTYADWWAAEKQAAHQEFEAHTWPAIQYAFSLPARIRGKLAAAMRAWPEEEDPEAVKAADRCCKGPAGDFRAWWIDNAIALLLCR